MAPFLVSPLKPAENALVRARVVGHHLAKSVSVALDTGRARTSHALLATFPVLVAEDALEQLAAVGAG